jgi:hypothetical protein
MSKNVVETRGATDYVTIWRIRVACRVSKAICKYAHAHDHALGYPHERTYAQACTHRPMWNTYCFPTATVVSWTRLCVTLYVHCLSCVYLLTLRHMWLRVRQWKFLSLDSLGWLHCSLYIWHLPKRAQKWIQTPWETPEPLAWLAFKIEFS